MRIKDDHYWLKQNSYEQGQKPSHHPLIFVISARSYFKLTVSIIDIS